MEVKAKVVLLTEDELISVIHKANGPLTQRMDAIERKMAQEKICYSIAEMGELINVSPRAIRRWISEGKIDYRGVHHRLPAYELVAGRFAVELSDVKAFIQKFKA